MTPYEMYKELETLNNAAMQIFIASPSSKGVIYTHSNYEPLGICIFYDYMDRDEWMSDNVFYSYKAIKAFLNEKE